METVVWDPIVLRMTLAACEKIFRVVSTNVRSKIGARKLLAFVAREKRKSGALSFQPKIPVISVGTSNGTAHFGLVRPEYSGPALKVVHFDRSDRNFPFHLTNLLFPVPLFCTCIQRQNG